MVKTEKNRSSANRKTKPIAGKTKPRKKQHEDGEVEEVMGWGKSKENYYQDEQNQYSSASEQQDQVKQIYDNQYGQLNNLNQQEFYNLPEDQSKHGDSELEEEEEAENMINDEYVTREIVWVTGLAKIFQTVQDHKASFRKKVYDSYLLILLALKQFKIPYVDQHPLVVNLPLLKKALQHFEAEIPKLQKQLQQQFEEDEELSQKQQQDEQEEEENEEEENNQEEDGEEDELNNFNQQFEQFQKYMEDGEGMEDQISAQETKSKSHAKSQVKKQPKNIKQGLDIYEQIKKQKEDERKTKKKENKKNRELTQTKQAFKLVNENEARLANEKILKNKGLLKRRQKGDGNSRTKLRGKYEKALIRRRAKGIIGVKENPGRFYEGQDKVLYGKIASTKLK